MSKVSDESSIALSALIRIHIMMIFEEKIKVLDDIFIHTIHENYKSVPE
jgi:hypothetical protein